MKMLGKLTAGAIVFGLLVAPAGAQEMRAASEKVVACQDVEDALARLDCFEVAAAELSAALSAPVPEMVVTAPTPSPSVPAAPTEQAAVTAPAAVGTAPAAVQQASTEAPVEPNEPKSSLPSWIPRVTFGQDRDVEKEPDEYQTTITRIQVNRIGRHFFTTAEGHIWSQQEITEVRAPKTLPAEAILYQNIMGGLRIKIVETDRSYSVERVE